MAASRIKINRSAIRELMRNESLVGPRAEAIAAACNGDSSWGGYGSDVEVSAVRARAHVWTYARQDGTGATERANRMLRHLGAGSGLVSYTSKAGRTSLITQAQHDNYSGKNR